MAFWVRVIDLLITVMTKEVGESIGKTLGSLLRVDVDRDRNVRGDYLRIRVMIDVHKPLKGGKTEDLSE